MIHKQLGRVRNSSSKLCKVDVGNSQTISCEIYSDDNPTDVDNYATCAKYGNDEILGLGGVTVNANGRPTYTQNTGTAYQQIMTYMNQYNDAELQTQIVDTSTNNVCLPITDGYHPKLTLNSWSAGSFSYAVDTGVCKIAAVEMKETLGACSKTCGCGIQIRTYTCVFSEGNGP